mgnify:CR=1 FL=1
MEEINQDNPCNLPANLTTLEENAFLNCTGITRVCLPEGVTAVPKYAFNGCTKLNGVVLSEQTATIGDWAFAGTALTGISLPATVTALGDNVFHNCSELIGIQSYATIAPTITATTSVMIRHYQRAVPVVCPSRCIIGIRQLEKLFQSTGCGLDCATIIVCPFRSALFGEKKSFY